jgi:hypothetical protein
VLGAISRILGPPNGPAQQQTPVRYVCPMRMTCDMKQLTARSRQGESKEVGGVGSKRTSSGGGGAMGGMSFGGLG